MIPPIVPIRTLRELLREHGWGHLAAPIKPAEVLPVGGDVRVVHRAATADGPAVAALWVGDEWQPTWSGFPGDWT